MLPAASGVGGEHPALHEPGEQGQASIWRRESDRSDTVPAVSPRRTGASRSERGVVPGDPGPCRVVREVKRMRLPRGVGRIGRRMEPRGYRVWLSTTVQRWICSGLPKAETLSERKSRSPSASTSMGIIVPEADTAGRLICEKTPDPSFNQMG